MNYTDFNKAKSELNIINDSKKVLHNKIFGGLVCGSESIMENPQLDMITYFSSGRHKMSVQHLLENVDENSIDDYIEEYLYKFVSLLEYKESLSKKAFIEFLKK